MAKFFFAGDTHSFLEHWDYLIGHCVNQNLDTIYQVGDFGYWEHTHKGERYLDGLQDELARANLTVRWVDGNHENHELLRSKYEVTAPAAYRIRPNIIYQSRGSTLEVDGVKLLFVGGATSIDKGGRTQGVSWWPEEALTYGEVMNAIEAGAGADILVSHDAPLGNYHMNNVLNEQLKDSSSMWHQVFLESYAHRKMIYEIVDAVRPRFVVHGHYHYSHQATLRVGADDVRIIGLDQSGKGLKSWKVLEVTPRKKRPDADN